MYSIAKGRKANQGHRAKMALTVCKGLKDRQAQALLSLTTMVHSLVSWLNFLHPGKSLPSWWTIARVWCRWLGYHIRTATIMTSPPWRTWLMHTARTCMPTLFKG